MTSHSAPMPNEIFERLGEGDIAYVRPIRSDDIADLFSSPAPCNDNDAAPTPTTDPAWATTSVCVTQDRPLTT